MATGPQLYTVSALAVEFQKDNRTIAKRLEGVEPDKIRGKRRYWYMRTAAPAILGMTALDPTRQKAELDAARTRKLDIEIAKLEGTLVAADEVREMVATMTSRLRARLLAVPGSQAGRANPDNPKRAEDAIRDGIYEALTELADDPLGGGSAPATAKVNGKRVGRCKQKAESGVESGAGKVAN